MITQELKRRILEALAKSREMFSGSDAKFSVSIGISASQYSRVKNGDTEKVLSDAQWLSIARKLGVSPTEKIKWNTADTPVFQYIYTQLERCRKTSDSAMLCDLSDIGKSHIAEHYAATHKNVCYVDCSQVKSKHKLVKFIAKSFGVDSDLRYNEVYENLVFYLKTLDEPLIILDEAGDLEYSAFLELKALWNASKLACGWYMMGADALKFKIKRAIAGKKVGYAEIFSRYGKRYLAVVPMNKEEKTRLLMENAIQIAMANKRDGMTCDDVKKLVRSTLDEDNTPSLRRIRKELEKI